MGGWQAIEEYLSEVEREFHNIDQRVPQQYQEDVVDSMLYTDITEFNGTDYLSEGEYGLTKPTQVMVHSPSEQNVFEESSGDLCDLDNNTQNNDVCDLLLINHETQQFNFQNLSPCVNQKQQDHQQQQQHHQQQQQQQQQQCLGYDSSYLFDNPAYRMSETMPTDLEDQRCSSNASSDFLGEETINRAFSEYYRDIEYTCRCLGISHDPQSWNTEDVYRWLVWQCKQDQVAIPEMDYFRFDGGALCNLAEGYFKQFLPENGSEIHSRLTIWQTAAQQTTATFPPAMTVIPVPRSPTVSPVPDNVSLSPVSPGSRFMDDECSQTGSSPSPYYNSDDNDRLPDEPVHHHRQTIQLWQFLKLLLLDGHYTDCIRWLDRSRGIFKIENSNRVAKLWGKRKNRPAMNYDKLSRSIRQYYKKNIIKKTEHSKRLVYQFCHM